MEQNQQKGGHTASALLLGVAIGSVATFLMRRENRDMVQEAYNEMKYRGKRSLEQAQSKAQEVRDQARIKGREMQIKAENIIENAQNVN